jgi:threonine dehydrogenase-like Zn-dependent dehydrogenase
MKALRYRKSIPRYALLKLLGRRFPGLYTSGLPPVKLEDIPEPELPTPHWVRVAPRLAGICGSDLATVCASGSPYLAPVTSLPFVLGHEVVGRVVELGGEVADLSIGDRVVLHPALGCKARGIRPECDACRQGRDALCRNVTRGDISAGIQTGYCRDTGGAFSGGFVAHESQVYRVPDGMSDEAAVLIEPFACALHAALRANLTEDDTALVIGCGAIGLLTIAAIRATGCKARIAAVAKHDHQREHALGLGANELLDNCGPVKRRYARWAKALDAEALDPEIGKPAVIGGAAATFDCVASSRSIDDGLRFTRGGGTFVLVGMPGIPFGVDWTPLWYKELTIRAAYAYGPERCADGERETFELAIELARDRADKLAPLVGPPHALTEYRAAFASALNTGKSRVAKTVFAIDDEA